MEIHAYLDFWNSSGCATRTSFRRARVMATFKRRSSKTKPRSARSDERKDHDIAFAALEPFDRIDRDLRAIQHLPKQNHLCAKWRNDADGSGRDAAGRV